VFKVITIALLTLLAFPQEDASFKSVFHRDWEGGQFAIDKSGNAYFYVGDELRKVSTSANQAYTVTHTFSDKLAGEITSVDASNPLRILLWYADQRQLITVDNTLSQHNNTVYLDDPAFDAVQLVCASANNHLWFYDQANMEVLRVTRKLEIINRSGQIAMFLNREIDPTQLKEVNETLYLLDETGLMIFDLFGTYIKTLPIKNATSFQVMDNEDIWFVAAGKPQIWRKYDVEPTEISEVSQLDCDQLYFQNEKLYTIADSGFTIYEHQRK